MLAILSLYMLLMIDEIDSSTGACRIDECSLMFSRRQQYEYPDRVRSESYCQLLHSMIGCLDDTNLHCRGNIKYHSHVYAVRRQWREYECASLHLRRGDQNRCHFLPAASQRSVRYCAAYGASHVRVLNGSFITCRDQGATPLINNRYFAVQSTLIPNKAAPLSSHSTRLTVLVKKHNCTTRQLTYQASSDEPLPVGFDDGSSFVNVDGDRRSIEVLRQDVDYIELNLRYIDSSVHIRKHSQYLSVAIRGPEFVLKATSSLSDQLCTTGCRSGHIQLEKVFATPTKFAKCQARSSTVIRKTEAQERCRDSGVVDAFFDSCVFDLMMTGDENFVSASRLAQSDFRRVFPLHYHYVQGRNELLPYHNVTSPYPFDYCLPSSTNLRSSLLYTVALLFSFLFL